GKELYEGNIENVRAIQLPDYADLAWASFPCQDLSLAGSGAGLKGSRSGTFWPFWRLIEQLENLGRAPRLVVLENVYGALSSHGGRDFATIARSLHETGYRFGALIIDAVHWLPQSRPRLFIVAARTKLRLPERLMSESQVWHPHPIQRAFNRQSPP